jgi:NADPH:quinone reductase-like Zn-dependent oxidoreductase
MTNEPALPVPQQGEVLVRVRAVSLNYRDLAIAQDKYPLPVKDNVVPCSDCAGEVVQVGASVSEFKVGDRVAGAFLQDLLDGEGDDRTLSSNLGGQYDGVLAEYRVFPEHGLVAMPRHLSYEEAATLPCAGVTAWNALYGLRPLLPGQTVLLEGTGGVSMFGLQIAAAGGARTIVTSSSNEKLQIAKMNGATHLINYRETPDWHEQVMRLTGGRGAEHVLDIGGPSTLDKALACTAHGGVVSVIGFRGSESGGGDLNLPAMMLARTPLMRGVMVGSRKQFM